MFICVFPMLSLTSYEMSQFFYHIILPIFCLYLPTSEEAYGSIHVQCHVDWNTHFLQRRGERERNFLYKKISVASFLQSSILRHFCGSVITDKMDRKCLNILVTSFTHILCRQFQVRSRHFSSDCSFPHRCGFISHKFYSRQIWSWCWCCCCCCCRCCFCC